MQSGCSKSAISVALQKQTLRSHAGQFLRAGRKTRTSDVRKKLSRLPRDVRSDVPRVRPRIERLVCERIDFVIPSLHGLLSGIDYAEAIALHVFDTTRYPLGGAFPLSGMVYNTPGDVGP